MKMDWEREMISMLMDDNMNLIVGMLTLTRDDAYIYILMFWFQTPLHHAAYKKSEDVVEILLRNGATVNNRNVRDSSFWEKQMIEKRESIKNSQFEQ